MSNSRDINPTLAEVLESAARLQQLVPDAVLVGGTAAALHAEHRLSYDHDHVVADLRDRFEIILEAIERDDGWALNRLVPGKIILGELGGIETGIRQMIRARPLEVSEFTLASGAVVTAPTLEEIVRIKAFLVVRRNRVRDFVDLAALTEQLGTEESATVLDHIDEYYADEPTGERAVASQVSRQLYEPRPVDVAAIDELHELKGLDTRWTWAAICTQLVDVARAMVDVSADA